MFSVEDAADTVDLAQHQARSGDIVIRKMKCVALSDIIGLFDGAEVRIVGKRPGEKMHETLYVQGEINTGYETADFYVLNRHAATRLPLENIDSSQVPRVEPQRLRDWFEKVKKQAA
jgi:FlaA1/EpsC-like NDP-sugar epimerase